MPGWTEWRTPPEFFAKLDAEFHFTVDVAATDENTLVPDHYYTKETDGLAQDWSGERVWCNPPFNNQGAWVRKGAEAARNGALVVFLLLAGSTDTAWFHNFVWDDKLHRPRGRVELRLIRGRIRFHGEQGTPIPAPRYGNMLIIFHPGAGGGV